MADRWFQSTDRFGFLRVIAPSFFNGFSRRRWQTLIEDLKSNIICQHFVGFLAVQKLAAKASVPISSLNPVACNHFLTLRYICDAIFMMISSGIWSCCSGIPLISMHSFLPYCSKSLLSICQGVYRLSLRYFPSSGCLLFSFGSYTGY